MHFISVGIGSSGDINPHIGLGRRLQARGHQVTVLGCAVYRKLVEKAGLEFGEVLSTELYDRVTSDPDLWHPTKGMQVFARDALVPAMRASYQEIEARRDDDTVVLAPATAIGARIAHDRLGVPLITTHLQPAMLRSLHEPPLMPGVPLRPWMPKFLKRAVYRLIDRAGDGLLAGPINEFRGELELPPVRRIMQWWESPQAVTGLFPDWFAPPQPDWAPHTTLTQFPTEFPLYDGDDIVELSAEAQAFLADDSPLLVFTAGSANRTAPEFFAASIAACQKLGYRGFMLTPHPEQLPDPLPAGIGCFGYVPLNKVLPRAAVLAHHGGIGMSSLGLAHGTPHLVTPRCYDQPDNAARLEKLGVARTLVPKRYHADSAAAVLRDLIENPDIAAACRRQAARFEGLDGLARIADTVESQARQLL